ncbi:MAG: isochorismatase family protein, partial [candidate division NC10 bacterium]
MTAGLVSRNDAILVIVDIQEKLVPAIHAALGTRAIKNATVLIEAAAILGVPIVVTEQYPQGLGRTVPEILLALADRPYQLVEKVAFSCARDEAFSAAVSALGRRQVLVAGMEAHVCVYQTAVDLVRAGHAVFVLDDAVASRSLHNYQSALQALREAGCTVCSTESAIFQLLERAATPEFK